MPRDYFDVIREGKEAVVNGFQDLLGVASGQVRSTDGASEEGVPGDEKGLIREVETTAAQGVAGGMDDGPGEELARAGVESGRLRRC